MVNGEVDNWQSTRRSSLNQWKNGKGKANLHNKDTNFHHLNLLNNLGIITNRVIYYPLSYGMNTKDSVVPMK